MQTFDNVITGYFYFSYTCTGSIQNYPLDIAKDNTRKKITLSSIAGLLLNNTMQEFDKATNIISSHI